MTGNQKKLPGISENSREPGTTGKPAPTRASGTTANPGTTTPAATRITTGTTTPAATQDLAEIISSNLKKLIASRHRAPGHAQEAF